MDQLLWFGWFRADIIAEYAALFWRGLQMTIMPMATARPNILPAALKAP